MTDTMQLLLLCCGSILVGGVFIYLLFLRRKPDTHATEQEEKRHQQHQESNQREVNNTHTTSTTSKKQARSKKRREAQQEFTHSWMVGALKGHSGPVLDVNFSANGKFLATCADEEAAGKPSTITKAKKLQQQPQPPPSPSGSSKSSSSSSSSASSSSSSSSSEREPRRAILSRRQRKNRTRAPRRDNNDDRPPPPTHSTSSVKQDIQARRWKEKKKQPVQELQTSHNETMAHNRLYVCSMYTDSSNEIVSQHHSNSSGKPRLLADLSDAALSNLLRSYVLSRGEMQTLGYPLAFESSRGTVAVFNQQSHGTRVQHHRSSNQLERKPGASKLNVNAREFVPASRRSFASSEADSGRGSSSGSSVEGSDLEPESSSESDKSSEGGESLSAHMLERRCVRCSKSFYVWRQGGEYVREDHCFYHWGKLYKNGWECCNRDKSSNGCTSAQAHVWTGVVDGRNGPFLGYTQTEPSKTIPHDGDYGVYALDCEMCFTKNGLEVGRVTVVNLNGDVVYESMVRPYAKIIDYNTRFSGLRARDFVNAKSLAQVHRELKAFIFSQTILIGHALENDLRALKLLHETVIDTTAWYPHVLGLPYRQSLKYLAGHYLEKAIQQHEHDSAEDARIALDLMYYKLIQDCGI